MRVFVTGGTGTIGTAVVAELLSHDHSVLALARSDRSEQALTAAGATVVRGAITDLELLRDSATQCDGIISLAFGSNGAGPEALIRAIAEEAAALRTLGEALIDTGKPIVAVAGTPQTPGRAATEADPSSTAGPVGGRARSVSALLELAADGVRPSTVRMPRTVHNEGKGGFAGVLVDSARRTGIVGYPDDGTQRWPAVHALDAATLFRIALESAPPGTIWHAVADEGDAVRDIAAVIGRRLRLPTEPVPPQMFGPLGPIFALDQPASSLHTREALGWQPTRPSLLEDLENIQP